MSKRDDALRESDKARELDEWQLRNEPGCEKQVSVQGERQLRPCNRTARWAVSGPNGPLWYCSQHAAAFIR